MRFAVDGFMSEDPPYPTPSNATAVVDGVDATLRRLLANETVTKARREFALMWTTAMGFRRVWEEGPAPELEDATVIAIDPKNPLAFIDVNDDSFPTSVGLPQFR